MATVKGPVSLVFLLGVALTLAGCGNVLFDADFEADLEGLHPSTSPAGPPTGDMIRVWTDDPGNLIVTGSGISGKSLLYRYTGTPSQVDFIGTEMERNPPQYWAVWTGRAEEFTAATPRLAFSVGNFNIGRANLEIVNAQFVASGRVLGDLVPDEDHTVIVHIDNMEGTYMVSALQRGGGVVDVGPMELTNRGLVPGDSALDISMFFDALPVSDSGRYLIDNILMTEEAPDLP
jgi:hypothetical protein